MSKNEFALNAPLSLKEKYLIFCKNQNKNLFLWYAMALITISCIILPIGLFLLRDSDYYLLYTVFCGASLYANVIPHIAGFRAELIIVIYLLTLFLHFGMISFHTIYQLLISLPLF